MKKMITRFFIVIVFALNLTASFTSADSESPYQLNKILNVTNVLDEVNIPIYEKYLQNSDGRIEKYAAAQALFLMDSKRGRDVLDKHIFTTPSYNFSQSIRYMFGWRMPSEKRNRFIKEYHLQSTSKLISLEINITQSTITNMEYSVVLKNESESTIRLYKPIAYLGRHILIISSTGEVMPHGMTAMYMLRRRTPEETYIELPPKESFVFTFAGVIKKGSDHPDSEFPNGRWLDCGDFAHKLPESGTLIVYGNYSHAPSVNHPYANIWTGRVVSPPVEIKLNTTKWN